jgi:hypothetical protein
MVSPLRKQRDALLKKRINLSESKSVKTGEQPDSLHLLLGEMDNDIKRLKELDRIDDRNDLKRDELIPKYRASVEEYLKSETPFKNSLFSNMVVWMFDIEELDTAIAWCDIAIVQGFESPFKRDFKHFCADMVLAWADKMTDEGHSVEPYFTTVFDKVKNDWRLNEKLTAKYYKFAGLLLINDENGKPLASQVGDINQLKAALALLEEADNQDSKAGVSTHIAKIEQRIRALEDGANL